LLIGINKSNHEHFTSQITNLSLIVPSCIALPVASDWSTSKQHNCPTNQRPRFKFYLWRKDSRSTRPDFDQWNPWT